ncbi:MAG: phosphatase PAP2 family protein [Clostridia bacterium]|nr:phosphatase PAP2 family protein [Clostridia bacterium]
MTRETYIRMTTATRRTLDRLPGGAKLLRLPTLIYIGSYLLALFYLMLMRDIRLVRVLLVPAACFMACTALRPIIGRERPYDHFDAEPVGRYKRGKGKSMPSRHTACAAAIALAAAYAFPHPAIVVSMVLLCVLIASLRVLCGQHYISDVLAALLLSSALSLIGYVLI